MSTMTAIELDGVVEDGQLKLKEPLPNTVPTQVKVIVMYPQDLDLSDEEFEALMIRSREKFSGGAYETKEQVLELIREVKIEQAREKGWLE